MMKLWKIMVLAMALSLTLTGAFAATYSVPGDYATMAAAQADGAVLAGDTIQVANTHSETDFVPTKSLNYVSWDTTGGAAAAGATCQGYTYMNSSVTISFDGFTFTRTGDTAVEVRDNPSTITFSNCTFTDCAASLWAVMDNDNIAGSTINFDTCLFDNVNRAYTSTDSDVDAPSNGIAVNMTDCTISNAAEFGLLNDGDSCTFTLTNCNLSNITLDAFLNTGVARHNKVIYNNVNIDGANYGYIDIGWDNEFIATGGSILNTYDTAFGCGGEGSTFDITGMTIQNVNRLALLMEFGGGSTADNQVFTVTDCDITTMRHEGTAIEANAAFCDLTFDNVTYSNTWFNGIMIKGQSTDLTIKDSDFDNIGQDGWLDRFHVVYIPEWWGGVNSIGTPNKFKVTDSNFTNSAGGGFFIGDKTSTCLMSNVLIQNCNQRFGLWIDDGGNVQNGTTYEMNNVTIDNVAQSGIENLRDVDLIMNGCTIRNAANHGINTFWENNGTQFNLTNCTIEDTGWDAIALGRAVDLTMTGCTIQRCGFGIFQSDDGGHAGNNTITLDNCSITTNRQAGLEIRKVADVNILNGSDISYNAASGLYISGNANGCNVILDNSSFTYNGDNGMWNDGSNSIDIADCTFDYNEQNGLGGAWNSNGTTLNAVGTSFDHNATDSSDANAAGFFPFRNWDSTFSNCTFNSNGDGINNFGRGVHAWDPPGNGNQMQFSQCQFNNNDGRGIEINNQSITTLTYCQIQNNGAQGIFRSGNNGAVENARLITEMTLDNCDLIGNAEEGIEMYGAGVVLNLIDSDITGSGQTAIGVFNDWLYGESQHVEINAERCTLQSVGTDPGQDVVSIVSGIANLNNCLITGGRYSCVNGAQTRAWDGSPTTNTRASTMTISYCDILGYDGSHGVLAWGSEEVNTTIYNSILDGLSSATVVRRGDGFTTPSIEMVNNIVRGPAPFVEEWGWNFSDNPSSGSRVLALPADNYTSAPLFTSTNTTVLSGDYELQFDSPAIDVADISTYAAATVDIRNFSRDATPDLGAYEFGAGDDAAPTAALSAPSLLIFTPAKAVYTFTVTYYDNSAVSAASLDSSDVVVTGPRGYDEAATFVSASPATDGTPIEVTYTVPAPNGSEWLTTDWGTYTVDLNADQVEDIYNNLMPAETLGTFRVGTMPRAAAKNWELY